MEFSADWAWRFPGLLRIKFIGKGCGNRWLGFESYLYYLAGVWAGDLTVSLLPPLYNRDKILFVLWDSDEE